jgi:NAD+ diphosphatase
VEPGESLEEAVHREVREESGVEIKNLRYLASQPWPFPDSLMFGFHAEWKSGEPRPDGKEILDVRWFELNNLPRLPGPGSMARKLLEWWIQLNSESK